MKKAARKGAIVKTKKGKKGLVYWDEVDDKAPKIKVRLIDSNYQETGEKLYVNREPSKL